MNDISKQVLTAIIELAICKDTMEITTPWAGLRLRAALRENEDGILSEALDDLRDKETSIISWHIEDASVVIAVATRQKIPESSPSEKEIICDRALKRALLYHLYEKYRSDGQRFTNYPLAQDKDILESSKDEIYRIVELLESDYYLEYKVCDGGMCTSDITFDGIKLCEIRNELFRVLGTLQITSEEKEDKNEGVSELSGDVKKVFVVHGRNDLARKAMFSFLRSIGLDPIEWTEALSYTEKGSPFIGEILDHAFNVAQAVIVLISGDDLAKLSSQYLDENDPGYERDFMQQPRPNVLFEAGLSFGRHPERTILVGIGSFKPFSDIAGRHIIRLNNSAKARQELVARLKTAKCAVSVENKTDWLHEGDFDKAIEEHEDFIKKEIQGLTTGKSEIDEMTYKGQFYFRSSDDMPHCPNCWERDRKAIHLVKPRPHEQGRPNYQCPSCKNLYWNR